MIGAPLQPPQMAPYWEPPMRVLLGQLCTGGQAWGNPFAGTSLAQLPARPPQGVGGTAAIAATIHVLAMVGAQF